MKNKYSTSPRKTVTQKDQLHQLLIYSYGKIEIKQFSKKHTKKQKLEIGAVEPAIEVEP